jgi:hypothetical protein
MLPGCVDELGVAEDVVDLALRAVAAHVVFLDHVVQVGVLVYTVDDVPEDFLFSLGTGEVPVGSSIRSQKDRCSGTLTTSFFGACEVSCRVRAERAIPYASVR